MNQWMEASRKRTSFDSGLSADVGEAREVERRARQQERLEGPRGPVGHEHEPVRVLEHDPLGARCLALRVLHQQRAPSEYRVRHSPE